MNIRCAFFLHLYSLFIPFSRPWHSSRVSLNANKPATPEPKQGKLTPTQLDSNKDLEVDLMKGEPSFCSFFSSAKSQEQKAKKGPGNGGGTYFLSFKLCCHVFTFHAQRPPVIRPQAWLNDRETLETEVISVSFPPRVTMDGSHYSLQSCSSTRMSRL